MATDDAPPQPTPGAPADGAARPPRRRRGFKRWIFLAFVVFGVAALAHVAYRGSRVDASVPGPAELERGPVAQVIAWPSPACGEGCTGVQISRLSRLNPDHIWRVVTDQGRFNEFMPYVRATTVRPGADGAVLESQVLDLPSGSYDLELEIRLSEKGPRREARWRQVKGALSFNEGAWVVEKAASAGGDVAILRYQVAARLSWAPQWAINYAMMRRLGKLLEAVEARVKDLEARDPEYFRAK